MSRSSACIVRTARLHGCTALLRIRTARLHGCIMLLCIATALLLVCTTAPAAAQGWEWQNPRPAGHDIADVLTFGSHAVAVCEGGFLMRSWDAGLTWETRRRFNDDLQHVERLPDGTLLVTSAQGSLFRSTNGGWDWEDALGVSQAAGNTDIAVLPDGNALVMLGGRTIFRSAAQGAAWNPIGTPGALQSEFYRSVIVKNDATWWVLSTRALYKTTNAGARWSEDSTISARGLIDLVVTDDGALWQLRDGQVLQSTDDGATWREMNLFGFGYNLALAAGSLMQGRLFVLSENEYVLNRSTDGGATWDVSLTSVALGGGYPTDMSFSSPDDGLVVGAGGRILRTSDGGLSWSIVHGIGPLEHIDDITFFSAREAYATTSREKVLVTTNGGVRWSELVPLPDWYLGRCSFHTDAAGFATAQPPSLQKTSVFTTTNRGRAWEYRSDLPFTYDPFFPVYANSVLGISSDEVWIGASFGGLYHSTDGGRTWDSVFVASQLSGEFYSGTQLQFIAPSTLLYFSYSSTCVSTDNGATWTYRRTPQGRTLVDPRFFDARTGVGILGGAFSRTTDGGATWTMTAETGLSQLSVISDRDLVAFRNGASQPTPSGFQAAAILRSSDGGATWSEHPTGERMSPEGMHFASLEEGWLWGWSGMIRHTGNGGLVHTGEAHAAAPTTFIRIVDLHPHPFVASTHQALTVGIDASTQGDAPIVVELVDALGRICATRHLSSQGRSTTIFDRSRFGASGLYHIRARSGTAHTSRPLLVH